LVVVVHPGHRLAGWKEVELKELSAEPFILFRDDFTLHHLIVEACRGAGFNPKVVFESSQWDFMTELVAARLGITLLPEEICRPLDPERFRVLQLIEPSVSWRLSMIWSKTNYLSYAAREWIRLIGENGIRDKKE
jgi:DNA-binding transcriptional LysR family regulator